ncbi:hypothetical protein ES708_00052 [subsurface metagenome]
MAQLSAAEKWCWVGILLLAGQSPVRGKLMLSNSKPMTENDIYRALRVSPKEKKSVFQTIKKMTEMDSLKWNGDCLEVIHFKDRQEVFESDLIDYHKKKSAELTPDKLLKTPELTPDLLLKEGEGRGERKDTTPLSKDKGAHTKQADPVVNEIFAEMRKVLGYKEPQVCEPGSPAPGEKKEAKDKVCGPGSLTPGEKTKAKDPIPNYGKEGKAIKRMLTRGFTREEILACWKGKVSQRGGEFVSMTWVNEDIGKKGAKSGGTHKRGDEEPSAERYRRGLE